VCVCVACWSPTSPCSGNVITRCSVSKPHGPVVMQYSVSGEWAPYSTLFRAVVMQSCALHGSTIEPVFRGCVFNPFTILCLYMLTFKTPFDMANGIRQRVKKTPIYLWFHFSFDSFLSLSVLGNILRLMREESAFLYESGKHNTSWNMLEWDVFSFANPYNSSSTSVIMPASAWLCAPYLALVKLRSWNPHWNREIFLNIFIIFSLLIYWIYSSPTFPNLSHWFSNFRKSSWSWVLVNLTGFRSLLTGYEAVGKRRYTL
jgi:hypothetical protein